MTLSEFSNALNDLILKAKDANLDIEDIIEEITIVLEELHTNDDETEEEDK